MLTVYFSNSIIQVIDGTGGKKPAVKSIYLLEAPEGSLINGMVTDPEALSAALRDFWAEKKLPKKGVSLVVNSTQLITKAVDAPNLKRSAMLDFLGREFQDEARGENPVFGWFVMSENKKAKSSRLFATMAPREYLNNLIALFRDLGITLCNVSSALGAALSLLQKLAPMKGQTGIVQIGDGTNLLNILLVDGAYFYSTTNRLFSEPGTPGYGVEVGRQVSNLLQFIKSQQLEAIVGNVYLAGLGETDEQNSVNAISIVAPDIETRRLAAGTAVTLRTEDADAFPRLVYPIGGLIRGENKTGLLVNVQEDPEKRREKRENMRRIIPVCIVGGVLGLAAAGLGGYYLILLGQYNELEDYLNDPLVVQNCSEYDQLSAENATIQAGIKEINSDWAAIYSYPQGNSALVAQLRALAQGYANIEFTSFTSGSGTLNITTTAPEVEKINQYIAILKQQDIFENVSYSGYAQSGANGEWSVNVSCVLSEKAGKTEEWMETHTGSPADYGEESEASTTGAESTPTQSTGADSTAASSAASTPAQSASADSAEAVPQPTGIFDNPRDWLQSTNQSELDAASALEQPPVH